MIILEYANNGMLFDYIRESGSFTTPLLRHYFT